jgi:hypothetical protein
MFFIPRSCTGSPGASGKPLNKDEPRRNAFAFAQFFGWGGEAFCFKCTEHHHGGSGLLTACSARSSDWSSTILAVRYIGLNGLRVVAT